MATIFSKIAAGEIPSYKVAENEQFYAFLDINPLAKGHTLVIPKREVDYFFDLTDEEIVYYVDTYQPMDKAGAYGVQEWIGYIGVENISGSYFNVMGLPVQRLYTELKKF